MISTILLAAGESRRFGSPKSLALINNTTAIAYIQQKLLISMCDEVLIVLGASREQILPQVLKDSKVKIVVNEHYERGQMSSIQCGLAACNPKSHGALIWPVDCPFIKTTTVDTLIKVYQESNKQIHIPTFEGKRGHPPLILKALFDRAIHQSLDFGLNHLFETTPPSTIEINDPGIVQTFNTHAEFEAIKKTLK